MDVPIHMDSITEQSIHTEAMAELQYDLDGAMASLAQKELYIKHLLHLNAEQNKHIMELMEQATARGKNTYMQRLEEENERLKKLISEKIDSALVNKMDVPIHMDSFIEQSIHTEAMAKLQHDLDCAMESLAQKELYIKHLLHLNAEQNKHIMELMEQATARGRHLHIQRLEEENERLKKLISESSESCV